MGEEPKTYERHVLYQNESFEIVSINWTSDSLSPLHNHGWSHCLVLIESGVFENRLDLGTKVETRLLEVGEVLSTPVGALHEIACKSPTGKTLHVYTPKIQEHGIAGRFCGPDPESLKPDIALDKTVAMEGLADLLSRFRGQSISTYSPYFMNQLFSGISAPMLMAEEFLAQTKTTLATSEASPVLSAMETEVISRLCALIGWGEHLADGVCVPGGSAANFMAMHCARHRAFPESKMHGLSGRNLKVFVSDEAHYSFKKACGVLGIGVNNLVPVPVDAKGRMNPKALDLLISKSRAAGDRPILVGATAGSTVLGAFDEIAPLASICQKHGVWLHVDAAWGGPVLFSNKLRPLMGGVELADSLTFDAHKLFGAALTTSFFLTKHPDILLQANDVAGGDYLFHASNPALDRGKISWQCGRRGDAASFWTIWKNLGTEGLGALVDRLTGLRDEVVAWIRMHDRLELVSDPEYLNLCVRVQPAGDRRDPHWSTRVREHLRERNLALVNYSTDDRGSFLRLILAHPYLRFHHVKQILEWALQFE